MSHGDRPRPRRAALDRGTSPAPLPPPGHAYAIGADARCSGDLVGWRLHVDGTQVGWSPSAWAQIESRARARGLARADRAARLRVWAQVGAQARAQLDRVKGPHRPS